MAAMKRRHFLQLGLAGLALGGCTPERTGAAAAPPLRVGMELSYPPFEMSDEQGRPAGVSVDLARALAAHLGRELVIENIPFDGLIPALRTGRIDLVISSMTATPQRAEAIAFSEPYARVGLCLLAGRGSSVRGLADADAPGRVIAVKQGTTGHLHATRNFRHARLLVLDKESSAVLEVAQGKADAFIYDQLSAWQNARRHPDTTRAILEPFQTEEWAVGLRQGDDALREQVNGFLRAFRAEGGFDRLGDRWLAEAKAAFQAQGIPFVF